MATNWDQYKVNSNSDQTDWDQYKVSKKNEESNISPDSLQEIKKNIRGSTPFDQIKAGILGLGQAGENIASTLTGGRAPKAIEDVENMTGGNKSPLAKMIGQYAPIAITAPEGLLGQMLSGGAYQALQSPEHPVRGMIEGAVVPPLLKIPKLISSSLKLTKNNIIENVMQKGKEEYLTHTKKYNDLWKDAANEGIGEVKYNPKFINLPAIKAYSTKRYFGALEKFLDNPSIENSQNAQSDLGKLVNKLNSRATLTSEESATLSAAEKAQNHIKDAMFRDKSGNINIPLKEKYDAITKSYGENVIPYKENKAIKLYKAKKLTLPELFERLKKGEFAAKKGEAHPEFANRDKLISAGKILGLGGLATGGLASGIYGANMIKKLLSGIGD